MAEVTRSRSVAIVGENWLIRTAIRRALESADDGNVVHGYASIADALEAAEFQAPEIVVIVPPLADDARNVSRFVSRLDRKTKKIVLPQEAREVRLLLDVAEAVLSPDDLKRESDANLCLRTVAAGFVVLSGTARAALLREEGDPASALIARYGLSRREMDALLQLANGLPNKTVAARLNLSEQTVKNTLVTAYRKLGVKGRVSAARLVLEEAPGAVQRAAGKSADAAPEAHA